jgi:hypothetical protein
MSAKQFKLLKGYKHMDTKTQSRKVNTIYHFTALLFSEKIKPIIFFYRDTNY